MPYFEIPLLATPQDLKVRLLGIDYGLRIRYRVAPEAGWTMDIDNASGVRVASGIPLVTGANLLDQYDELGVGGGLWVSAPLPDEEAPSYSQLGDIARLYFREYRF